LPFVLLLLDYWPLGRFARVQTSDAVELPSAGAWSHHLRTVLRLSLEKLPLFVLSAAASIAAFKAQDQLGAIAPLEGLDRSMRVDLALVSYAAYVWKMFWPTNLAVLYTLQHGWPFALVLLDGVFLAGVTCLAVRWRRSRPYLIVGWLWFLGVLVPMIGLVHVGAQWIADRYTYMSYIGLFIMLAWGGAAAARRLRLPRGVLLTLALAAILSLVPVTQRQLGYWENSVTLFTRSVGVTPDDWVVHHHLALALAGERRFAEADAQAATAQQLAPGQPLPTLTRGNIALNMGETARAARLFREVIAVKPYDLEARRKLAWTYATSDDPDLRSGRLALEHARILREKSPETDSIQFDVLAAAYAENGQFDEAVKTARRALNLARIAGEDTRPIQMRLALYQNQQPYHASPAPERSGRLAAWKGRP
jgi:protein O-mannosyl-transferase